MRLYLALIFIVTPALTHCGEEQHIEKRHEIVRSNNQSEDLKPDSPDENDEQDSEQQLPAVPEEMEEAKDEAGEEIDKKDPQKPKPAPNRGGEAFFKDEVLTAFALAGCENCHADPRQKPPVQGPLTIFSYGAMKSLLDKNQLLDKVMSKITHGGGDQCAGNLEESPCAEISQWWELEFGDDKEKDDQKPGPGTGELRTVSVTGTFTGWGADPSDPEAMVEIRIYLDTEEFGVTPAATTIASAKGFDNNTPGDHAFQIALDPKYIDNKKHKAYLYAVAGEEESPLKGSPMDYTAYKISDEGRAFYNNMVRPRLNACNGCHTFNYESHWSTLVSPSPAEGGTRDSNNLVKKMTGAINHAGGVFCQGGNGAICNQLKLWWDLEFNK